MANKYKNIVGRKLEIKTLESILNSKKAEFLALYGRRRIGKTFLIREIFSNTKCIFLHVTGQKDSSTQAQLAKFADAIETTFYVQGTKLQIPINWNEAFNLLTSTIKQFAGRKKVVIFIDEIPWIAKRKSGFLEALDYFWNTKWTYNPKLKLIVCGSAASWIINKIVKSKGGLHNRLTETMRLNPFTLRETKEYLFQIGVNLSNKQITEIFMVTGGVPHYLSRIKPGLSAAQNIDQLCFTQNGLLFSEFEKLFSSLFDHSEIHYELIQTIAKNRYGVAKTILAEKTKLSSSGGRLKEHLDELIEAGFVMKILPYGHKQKREYYRICDEYTYFYLSWIQPIKNTFRSIDSTCGYWLEKSNSSAWSSWAGYSFEAICYKHIHCIREKLGITAGAEVGAWRYSPKRIDKKTGAQIDLLFDRTDGVITICEIKYTKNPFKITKSEYKQMFNKVEIYKKVTGTDKQIFLVLISASGISNGEYSGIFTNLITLDDLFK